MDDNIREYAVATLTDIWSRLDWEKISTNRTLGIWEEFSNKVKACAMTTTSYETFVEKLCKKMTVKALKYADISMISDLDDETKKKILKCLREETQLVVLKLRLNNQIRKEMSKKEKKIMEENTDEK